TLTAPKRLPISFPHRASKSSSVFGAVNARTLPVMPRGGRRTSQSAALSLCACYRPNSFTGDLPMLKSLLTVAVVALSFVFAGHGAAEEKADAKDCCKAKLACCSAGKACCAAPAKLGCCDKGMKCCAKDAGCCAAVQDCCRKGEACCDDAKACCGAAPKKQDKEGRNCCDAGASCCATK